MEIKTIGDDANEKNPIQKMRRKHAMLSADGARTWKPRIAD